MTKSQMVHTLLAMKQFGGGFAGKLADAALVADPTNREIIMAAFPWIEERYGPGSNFYDAHQRLTTS